VYLYTAHLNKKSQGAESQQNKNVFRSRLNSLRHMSRCQSSTGRLFLSRGPATVKLQLKGMITVSFFRQEKPVTGVKHDGGLLTAGDLESWWWHNKLAGNNDNQSNREINNTYYILQHLWIKAKHTYTSNWNILQNERGSFITRVLSAASAANMSMPKPNVTKQYLYIIPKTRRAITSINYDHTPNKCIDFYWLPWNNPSGE